MFLSQISQMNSIGVGFKSNYEQGLRIQAKQGIHAKSLTRMSFEEDAKRNKPTSSPASFYTSEPANINKNAALSVAKNGNKKDILKIMGNILNESGELSSYSSYSQPCKYSYFDLGVDEKELIKDVKKVNGSVILHHSKLEDLGEIEYIDGDLVIPETCSIKDLSNIKKISGSVMLYGKNAPTAKDLNLKQSVVSGRIITTPFYL